MQLTTPSTSPKEAAAIVAALECFMRATAPPVNQPKASVNGWRRAALLEEVSRAPATDVPHPWINT